MDYLVYKRIEIFCFLFVLLWTSLFGHFVEKYYECVIPRIAVRGPMRKYDANDSHHRREAVKVP